MSVRPQFIIARAAIPIFSPSCGSIRIIAGPAGKVHSVPATNLRRDGVYAVVEQLKDDAVTKCIVGGVDNIG